MTPDGLISHLGGPFEGKLGDWVAWKEAGLEDRLRLLNEGVPPEEQVYLYGDPAYTVAYGIMGAYKAQLGNPLDTTLEALNSHMSSLRVSVEHGYGKTASLWSFNTHPRNMKMGLSPVAGYYMVSVLFTNIHTCMHGSQTSKQFGINPLTFDRYLQL